jgi:hypothetical protein
MNPTLTALNTLILQAVESEMPLADARGSDSAIDLMAEDWFSKTEIGLFINQLV